MCNYRLNEPLFTKVAEEEGLEPPQAKARQFSRLLQYHYAIPPRMRLIF